MQQLKKKFTLININNNNVINNSLLKMIPLQKKNKNKALKIKITCKNKKNNKAFYILDQERQYYSL